MKYPGRKEDEDSESRPFIAGDRRKHLRTHLLILNLKGDSGAKTFFGYAKNISRSGLFVSSVNPKDVGEEFTVEFNLHREERMIRCRCVVVWSRVYDKTSPYTPGMGLKFLDLAEDTMEYIDNWVKTSPSYL